MGLSFSKYEIEDYAINIIHSKEYNLSKKANYKLPLKNVNYYFNKQCTIIPLKYYSTFNVVPLVQKSTSTGGCGSVENVPPTKEIGYEII